MIYDGTMEHDDTGTTSFLSMTCPSQDRISPQGCWRCGHHHEKCHTAPALAYPLPHFRTKFGKPQTSHNHKPFPFCQEYVFKWETVTIDYWVLTHCANNGTRNATRASHTCWSLLVLFRTCVCMYIYNFCCFGNIFPVSSHGRAGNVKMQERPEY